jgi:rhodanese-related sulfurtransferase
MLRQQGVDARALIGGYAKWTQSGGKVETGR